MSSGVSEAAQKEADSFKQQGNDYFTAGKYKEAIEFYSKAISLVPTQHVFYSNRSAAYLGAKEYELAIKDGNRCTELAPNWSKGYLRLGAGLSAGGRYTEAIRAYKDGLALDPSNKSLQKELSEAQRNESILRLHKSTTETPKTEESEKNLQQEDKPDADALLSDFLGEVGTIQNAIANGTFSSKEDTETKKQERSNWNPGTPEEIVERILQDNYKWINLNPYEVLDLSVDAEEDEIKAHYRKLSSMVHPDKNPDPRATDAFQELKKAYEQLQIPERKEMILDLIQGAITDIDRARKRKIKAGTPADELPDRKEEILLKTRERFAEHEVRKRTFERKIKAHAQREVEKEQEEAEQKATEEERQQEWNQGRKQRYGSWQDFVKKKGHKRVGLDNTAIRYGKAVEAKKLRPDEEYKKTWR